MPAYQPSPVSPSNILRAVFLVQQRLQMHRCPRVTTGQGVESRVRQALQTSPIVAAWLRCRRAGQGSRPSVVSSRCVLSCRGLSVEDRRAGRGRRRSRKGPSGLTSRQCREPLFGTTWQGVESDRPGTAVDPGSALSPSDCFEVAGAPGRGTAIAAVWLGCASSSYHSRRRSLHHGWRCRGVSPPARRSAGPRAHMRSSAEALL